MLLAYNCRWIHGNIYQVRFNYKSYAAPNFSMFYVIENLQSELIISDVYYSTIINRRYNSARSINAFTVCLTCHAYYSVIKV